MSGYHREGPTTAGAVSGVADAVKDSLDEAWAEAEAEGGVSAQASGTNEWVASERIVCVEPSRTHKLSLC